MALIMRTYHCQSCPKRCQAFVQHKFTPPNLYCHTEQTKQKWKLFIEPPTEAQKEVIQHICENLKLSFRGKTKFEAHIFIKEHMAASKKYAQTHNIKKTSGEVDGPTNN